MVRRITQKKRGVKTRKEKKLFILGLEGKNETEKNYFMSFNPILKKARIQCNVSNTTDPVGLVNDLIKLKKNELLEPDDTICCVLDADTEPYKEKQIQEAAKLANTNKIELIISNPSFEIWFLLHFIYTTKYYDNKSLIDDLKAYVPNYKKSGSIFNDIKVDTEKAIINAKRLDEHHNQQNKTKYLDRNPSTDVWKLVSWISNEIN